MFKYIVKVEGRSFMIRTDAKANLLQELYRKMHPNSTGCFDLQLIKLECHDAQLNHHYEIDDLEDLPDSGVLSIFIP